MARKSSPKRGPKKDKAKSAIVVEASVVSSKKKTKKNVRPATPIETELWTDDSKNDASLVPSDPLLLYLSEIRKYPLLTKDEEQELTLRYHKNRDPIAAEKLVTSNLRFVVKIALEYSKYGAKIMDVIQEGNVGLMHAVKEFNPYKGVRLITYAVWWIRGYIRDYLLKQYSVVKIGTTRNQKKLFYRLQKEQQKMESLGQEAPLALLSSRLDVSEKDVQIMNQRMRNRDISLDAPLDDESGTHLIDLQSDGSESPDRQIENNQLVELLKTKVAEIKPSLNDKELAILEERILSDEPKTLQEIGDRFGITRERARQLEERLIKNLKESFFK